jgi:hypothetical protein
LKKVRHHESSTGIPQMQLEENLLEKILKALYLDKVDIVVFTKHVIEKHGLYSLYDGMASSIVGSMLQNGMYFCSHQFWTYLLDHLKLHPKSKVLDSMFLNLISAICTAIVTNPVWVLNTRMAKRHADVIAFFKYRNMK